MRPRWPGPLLGGGQQDTEGFALTAKTGMHRVLGGECFPGRADGVDGVGLATTALGWAFRPADLDDPFTGRVEERAVASDTFQRPTPSAGKLLASGAPRDTTGWCPPRIKIEPSSSTWHVPH